MDVRHPDYRKLLLLLASFWLTQCLLIVHDFDHPVLDDHLCQICLHAPSPGHALAPSLALLLVPPRLDLPAPVIFIFLRTLTYSHRWIRAPPHLLS